MSCIQLYMMMINTITQGIIILSVIIMLNDYNSSSYYRANPYAQQGYLPNSAFKNRKPPSYLVQIPQGNEFFEPSAKKHYNYAHLSQIQEDKILDVMPTTPEHYPALQPSYLRSLNVQDIEGATPNTLISMAVKNKMKHREEIKKREAQKKMEIEREKIRNYVSATSNPNNSDLRSEALQKLKRDQNRVNYHQMVKKIKTEQMHNDQDNHNHNEAKSKKSGKYENENGYAHSSPKSLPASSPKFEPKLHYQALQQRQRELREKRDRQYEIAKKRQQNARQNYERELKGKQRIHSNQVEYQNRNQISGTQQRGATRQGGRQVPRERQQQSRTSKQNQYRYQSDNYHKQIKNNYDPQYDRERQQYQREREQYEREKKQYMESLALQQNQYQQKKQPYEQYQPQGQPQRYDQPQQSQKKYNLKGQEQDPQPYKQDQSYNQYSYRVNPPLSNLHPSSISLPPKAQTPNIIPTVNQSHESRQQHRMQNPTYLSYGSPSIGLAGRNIVGY